MSVVFGLSVGVVVVGEVVGVGVVVVVVVVEWVWW